MNHLSFLAFTMAFFPGFASARLTGQETTNYGEDRQLQDVWHGNDGDFCLIPAQMTYCEDPEAQDTFECSPGVLLGACEDCLSGTSSWWWGGVPFTKCGYEPKWVDQTVCVPGVSCHNCQNGHHDEGILTFCGPDRSCKPAGEFVSWFGAHLCCNSHTVHWYGAIECN